MGYQQISDTAEDMFSEVEEVATVTAKNKIKNTQRRKG